MSQVSSSFCRKFPHYFTTDGGSQAVCTGKSQSAGIRQGSYPSRSLDAHLRNGTYHPARIKLAANQATELHFLRKDVSPCSEMLLIPDLEVSEILPVNKPTTIQLPPLAKGEYPFHCQMQMYRGVLTVE